MTPRSIETAEPPGPAGLGGRRARLARFGAGRGSGRGKTPGHTSGNGDPPGVGNGDPPGDTPTPTPGHRRSRALSRPRSRWLFVAPAVVLLLGLTAYPFGYAIFISLHTWKTTFPARPFIGLDNFRELLFDNERFINSVERTLFIASSALALQFLFGLAMALLFWTAYQRVRWVATAILVPMMIAPVVVGFTARMVFNNSFGFLNQILGLLWPGDVNIQWLSSPTIAPLVIILADTWQWGPFMFLILLAGLLATEGDQLEAAVVDGAKPLRLFWHVVLPSMKPILLVALVLRGLDLLRTFDLVALATRGGPGITTETITYYIYTLSFKFFDLGKGAAAALLMLGGLSIVVFFAVRSVVRAPR